MKEQKRFLELSEFEWRLLIKCLNEARSLFLDNGKSVEDIDELLIKAFKMKHKKVRNDYFTDIDRQAEEEFEQLVNRILTRRDTDCFNFARSETLSNLYRDNDFRFSLWYNVSE